MSRALVIDDKESGRRVLRIELQDAGFDVAVASDAYEGLALVASVDPSIVFTDYQMSGVDGIEFVRRVRQFSDIPVVLVTAYLSRELRERSIATGASVVLDLAAGFEPVGGVGEIGGVGALAQRLVTRWAALSRAPSRESLRRRDRVLKQSMIEELYLECGGNVSETARRANCSRGSVRYQLNQLRVDARPGS